MKWPRLIGKTYLGDIAGDVSEHPVNCDSAGVSVKRDIKDHRDGDAQRSDLYGHVVIGVVLQNVAFGLVQKR